MKATVMLASFMFVTAISAAQEITGDWNGTLSVGTTELRLVLHISKKPNG